MNLVENMMVREKLSVTYDYLLLYRNKLNNHYITEILLYPGRQESGVYRDPHVRSSIRHTLGFQMIFKVWLNQIFSNFNTMLWIIKYRLSSITMYFTFTIPELWPFFS